MKYRRRGFLVGACALVAVGALGAGSATADEAPDWIVIEESRTSHTYFDEELGQTITIDGTLSVAVPAGVDAKSRAAAAAGCTRTFFGGDPRKVRSTTAPYANYVVNNGYLTLSSGCPTREWVRLNLREVQPVLKPVVSEAGGYANPGGTRSLSVNYKCGSATHGYFSESIQLYQHAVSRTVRLCP